MTARQRAAHRIATGSATLARRAGAWLTPGHWQGTAIRAALLLAAWRIGWPMVENTPLLLWAGALAWTVAAWRAGTPAPHGDEQPDDDAPEHDPADVQAGLLQLLADCIGDGNGAHLADVLATLHHHGMLTDWDISDLRHAIEAHGVRVRDSLKVDGRVRKGVHRDDLPPLPAAPSDTPPAEVAHEVDPQVTAELPPTEQDPAPTGGGDPLGLDQHIEDALRLTH